MKVKTVAAMIMAQKARARAKAIVKVDLTSGKAAGRDRVLASGARQAVLGEIGVVVRAHPLLRLKGVS